MVGGFVLGGMVLAVAAILLFGGMTLFTTKTAAVVFFEGSVAGLQIGAPVTFRGVRVGAVRSISLRLDLQDLSAAIPVYLDLEETAVSAVNHARSSGVVTLPTLIAAGLRAKLATQSLVTGQLAVDLDLLPNTAAHLIGGGGDVTEIPALPSELQQIKSQVAEIPLRELAETAGRVLHSLDAMSTRLNTTIGPTLDSLRGTSDAAAATLATTARAIASLQTNAAGSLRNLDRLVADAQHQLDSGSVDLHRTLATADKALVQANQMMDTAKDLIEPRSQMRADLAAALRDLAASASALRGFSTEVERNPSALLTGRGGR